MSELRESAHADSGPTDQSSDAQRSIDAPRSGVTCLFCRIVRHEIPAKIVNETPDTIAFRDINPQAPQHILVIPRRHVANLNALDDPALVGKLAAAATDIARKEGFADSGYRIVINTLADGGQTVDHLHLHLLGGRHMKWPPG